MKPLALLFALIISASPAGGQPAGEFGDYWYQGKAELTSYTLEQARYGETHPGHAVLIFVTEDFSREKQVKLDRWDTAGDDAVKVLKLNFTRKFNTGIYPYSMMTSVFTPVYEEASPRTLKITTSSQEWCGHTFTQINRIDDGYRVQQNSYFESEGDRRLELPAVMVEDELWTLIRLDPSRLPVGEIRLLPGTMFQRLRHLPWEAQKAAARLEPVEGGVTTYTVEYPELKRTLTIRFNALFPHEIQGWEETAVSGWGDGAEVLTTRANLSRRILSDYWVKHRREDEALRRELGLE